MTTTEIYRLNRQLDALTVERLNNAHTPQLLALVARALDVLMDKNTPDMETGEGFEFYDFLRSAKYNAEYFFTEKYPEMMR